MLLDGGAGVREHKGLSDIQIAASTLIATGYIVPPISKLPFLNIMTDVLLMQVPAGDKKVTRLPQPQTSRSIGVNCISIQVNSGSRLKFYQKNCIRVDFMD